MENYGAIILPQYEVKKICGEEISFTIKGFISKTNAPDYWNILENHFQVPIVSIRPSGRDSWKEVIILYANGYITKDKKLCIVGDYDYIVKSMCQIFAEMENDELEVLSNYKFKASTKDLIKVNKWIKDRFGEEED